MSPLQIISSIYILVSMCLFAARPDLEIALVTISGMILLIAVTYLEKSQSDDFEELKKQVQSLRDNQQAMMLRAGLGR